MIIHTTHSAYRGRSVESIVRREYGRKAYVRYSADRNDLKLGLIVRDVPNTGSGWSAHVLGELKSVEAV